MLAFKTIKAQHLSPFLVCSPHSGREYLPSFLSQVRVPLKTLRQSEDAYVDELLHDAPLVGASILYAHFPRVYCDPNREEWELDPAMFSTPLHEGCNTSSTRVQAGIGTFHRFAAGKIPIYNHKLELTEAYHRLATCWRPYHEELSRLIDHIKTEFGYCLVIDTHSMPSFHGDDFIVGDAFSTSCHTAYIHALEEFIRNEGYQARRNVPFSGGYITRHYGKPKENVHVIQLEINRKLYMNQHTLDKTASFDNLRVTLTRIIKQMARFCLLNGGAF